MATWEVDLLRELRFVVPGCPVPAVRMTRYTRFSPDETKRAAVERYAAYKTAVGWAAHGAGAAQGDLWTGPLQLDVIVQVRSRGRWDGDNVLKSIADGLQGVAFKNDRQIIDWRLRVEVRPRMDDRVIVTLREVRA